DLDHITPSAAQFNTEKLRWLNAHYIKQADIKVLATDVVQRLEARGVNVSEHPELTAVNALYRERVHTLNELADTIAYVYHKPVMDVAAQEKHLTPEILPVLKTLVEQLAEIDWTAENIHSVIETAVQANGLKFPKIAMPLRVLLTGGAQSPGIDAVMELLGQKETITRVREGL